MSHSWINPTKLSPGARHILSVQHSQVRLRSLVYDSGSLTDTRWGVKTPHRRFHILNEYGDQSKNQKNISIGLTRSLCLSAITIIRRSYTVKESLQPSSTESNPKRVPVVNFQTDLQHATAPISLSFGHMATVVNSKPIQISSRMTDGVLNFC